VGVIRSLCLTHGLTLSGDGCSTSKIVFELNSRVPIVIVSNKFPLIFKKIQIPLSYVNSNNGVRQLMVVWDTLDCSY
jgi:hypothetical protein